MIATALLALSLVGAGPAVPREILVASAIQGAIFATTKAVINRGGARLFQRLTGEWPGD